MVYAVRAEREGETWFKLLTASLFYRLIYRITDVKIPLDTGDFRLMDRKVVNVMNTMRERHRFLRGMSAWVGFRQIGVNYKRAARFAGATKYPFKKMFKLALNAITGFSYFPLQLATYIGFVAAGLSILLIPVVIMIRALTGIETFLGQASTLVAVLFLGGVQLISLGILGEYIGRMYDEVKGRPLYVVSEAPDDDAASADASGMYPGMSRIQNSLRSNLHAMATIDLTIYPDRLERTVQQVRERNIIIPTFAQMKDPTPRAGQGSRGAQECGAVGCLPAEPVPHHLEK